MKLEDTRDGSRSDFKLRARGTVTTVQDGENLELAVKLCDVTLPEVSGYQPLLDPAFVARLAPLKIKGTIDDDNGFRLTTEPVALVLGAQLVNPLSNRLPATADDTRVKDQDQDGNPGVSIQIPGHGKIFGTMRVKVSIAATVAGAPSISGTSAIVLDQVVYGDDIWFYDAVTSIAESQAATRTISSANTFRMKSGVTGCTGVRQARVQRIASARVAPTTPHAAGDSRVGVQRTSISGTALYHPTGCMSFVYDGDGTDQLSNVWDAVDTAFTAWEGASKNLSCGAVKVEREVMPHAPDGRDGINTIHFRDDTWCRPATLTEPVVCHSPQAVAVTRILYVDDPLSPRDGEILEVDIEVNGVDFALATDGRAGAIDLSSAMAHEIGHALGLDHNCGVENGAWPSDINGAPVASCESASPELGLATMYFQVGPGTITMRTPEATDVDDLCEVVNGLSEPLIFTSGNGHAPQEPVHRRPDHPEASRGRSHTARDRHSCRPLRAACTRLCAWCRGEGQSCVRVRGPRVCWTWRLAR